MRLIDISQAVSEASAVFPGDRAFALEQRSWGGVVVGAVATTLHIGTHADSPAHLGAAGAGAGDLALAAFAGAAQIVERLGDDPIGERDARSWSLEPGVRYLVRTRRRVDPGVFPDPFAHLTPDAARALAGAGIALFGIDTPSVDHRDSRELPAHRALFDGGVAILENLDLGDVAPGRYELWAFPLRIPGADASPVRAVLRELQR